MAALIEFKNLSDIDKALKNEKVCRTYYEGIRWGGEICCPRCGNVEYYRLKPSKHQNEYQCKAKECFKRFNVLTGTVFENTKISLIIWFKAIHLCTTLSKGISSPNLAYQLGVTQKTAWFLLHRIREMLKEQAPVILEGEVECDESFIGGKEENKHEYKKLHENHAQGKTAVLGLIQRKGKLILGPIKAATTDIVQPIMVTRVKPTATIYTDTSSIYNKLKGLNYDHHTVNHSNGEYVRDKVYTNTLEGAFGLFKRKILGVHHSVSPKHLHRYCTEFSFTYNHRQVSGYERFNEALRRCNSRLLYKELIAN